GGPERQSVRSRDRTYPVRVDARPRHLRPRKDSTYRNHGMKRTVDWRSIVCGMVLGAAVATASASQSPRPPQIYVTGAGATLADQGLALSAPADAQAAGFREVPAPSLRNAPNSGYAQATLAPWVES